MEEDPEAFVDPNETYSTFNRSMAERFAERDQQQQEPSSKFEGLTVIDNSREEKVLDPE